MPEGYQQCEIDLVADSPGLTLFHRHQQLHLDYGFMTLLDYVQTVPTAGLHAFTPNLVTVWQLHRRYDRAA